MADSDKNEAATPAEQGAEPLPAVTQEETAEAPVEATGENQAGRSKSEKAEPINIVVRDQSGAGLQFKVRKNTKFEKVRPWSMSSHLDHDQVMVAFCQKKHYQVKQVRFLYEGERIREDQTPQDVDMEEGDIIDCVIEQLGG